MDGPDATPAALQAILGMMSKGLSLMPTSEANQVGFRRAVLFTHNCCVSAFHAAVRDFYSRPPPRYQGRN